MRRNMSTLPAAAMVIGAPINMAALEYSVTMKVNVAMPMGNCPNR